jgi:fructooligosaccharide transport system substrate-binding protein
VKKISRTRKLAVLAVVTAATAALLAGCSSSGSGSDSGGKVTLNIFRCTGCMPFDWQIDDFEKANPNITVKAQQVPFGSFYDKTSVLAASSNPPDVYTADQPTIANLASQGVISALDNDLPKSYVDDMTDSSKAGLTWDGKLYSPGPADAAMALYYNADALTKAGIALPSTSLDEAWTWDEAVDAMQKCQAANPGLFGLAPTTLGNGTPGSDYLTSIFMRGEGDPKAKKGSSAYNTYYGVSADGTKASGYVNTPEAIKGAQFYQDLFQKYKVSPTTGVPNAMIDGKACFEISTSTNISTLSKATLSYKWGVTPMPYSVTPFVHNGSLALAVGAKSKHRAEAVKFVEFVSSAKIQNESVEKAGYLPVLKSVAASNETLKDPKYQVFTDELAKWAAPRALTAGYLKYSDTITNTMRDVAYGTDPKTALDAAATKLDGLLK